MERFGSSIQFWQPNYKSELVYSSHVSKGEAIEVAFEAAASETKRLQEAASILRRAVQVAYAEAEAVTNGKWALPRHLLLRMTLRHLTGSAEVTTLRHAAQVVPPWAGWVWLTETSKNSSVQQSAVDYMAPVFAPVTEKATVQHILKLSRQASLEVQQYKVVTFDLAVAKKAYSLVWQSPEEFSDVIARMGSFHLTCAVMGALGRK